MTAIKCIQENKTLLDFSEYEKVSKNLVKQMLRQVDIVSYQDRGNCVSHNNYFINTGLYKIKLLLDDSYGSGARKLRNFGSFRVEILDAKDKPIHLWHDKNFSEQYWVWKNYAASVIGGKEEGQRVNDLINIIIHCSRLNKLKAFL